MLGALYPTAGQQENWSKFPKYQYVKALQLFEMNRFPGAVVGSKNGKVPAGAVTLSETQSIIKSHPLQRKAACFQHACATQNKKTPDTSVTI